METADAIVVLGCRVLPSGALSAPSRARTERAARAFFEGVAPVVLTSGGRRWGAHVEARQMRVALEAAGVPGDRIVEELLSLSTFENAVFTGAILRRAGAGRVALVTCGWHMARAATNFAGLGFDVVALPSEALSAPLARRAVRSAHEVLSGRLDAARRGRAALLVALADDFARGHGGLG